MSAVAISVRVRTRLARFELDLDVDTRARSLGIFGPSGAGKTTVLEAVAGWRRVDEGRVRVGDRVLLDTRAGTSVPLRERGIGYVPQDVLLFPHRTVRENVLAGAERARRAGRAGFDRAVEVLDLRALLDQSAASLSGGERQRVALARALCSAPDLLLLDEPLGALDLPLRRRVLPYLIQAREAFDLPMLFVSHDATEVQALCDEVVWLEDGRVRGRGDPRIVLRRAGVGTRFENVLRATVRSIEGGAARVEVAGGAEIQVPAAGLAAGERIVLALGADEILVSTAALSGISARNRLPARIESVEIDGGDAWATAALGAAADAARLSVYLTAASAAELALAPGRTVHLVFKTQSCRVLSRPA